MDPVSGPVARLALLARVDLLIWRHVLLAAYAEVALDRAAAHRAAIELAEARGAYACVPAGQQGARQREVLAYHAQLFARGVPERTVLLIAPGGPLAGSHQAITAAAVGGAVVVARFSECQRAQTRRRHRVALVVVARVARRQVQLLRRENRECKFVQCVNFKGSWAASLLHLFFSE